MTKDEMVGWHHRLNGHGFGWTLGVDDGQGGLACCYSWGHTESETTERLNRTECLLCFPGGSDSKKYTCSARDLGSIPGLGRSPGEGMATHSSMVAWRIPWTEELGRLQSRVALRVRHE